MTSRQFNAVLLAESSDSIFAEALIARGADAISPQPRKFPAPSPSLRWIGLPRPAIQKPRESLAPADRLRGSESRSSRTARSAALGSAPSPRSRAASNLRRLRPVHPEKIDWAAVCAAASTLH